MKIEHSAGRMRNLEQLARLLRRTPRTVKGWVESGCPAVRGRGAPGSAWQLDVARVVDWLISEAVEAERRKHAAEIQALRAQHGAPDADASVTSEDALKRKRLADARIAELNLRERREELIEMPKVERVLADLATVFRSRLLALPARAAPEVAEEGNVNVCRNLLRDYAEEVLRDISTMHIDFTCEVPGPDPDEETAE